MATPSTSTSTPAPAPIPSRTSLLFARGVIARLALWPALRTAVCNQWGGPSSAPKRTWLASLLVDAFEGASPVPDSEYVALMLMQAMEDEFEVVLEDGSAEEVGRDVVRIWEGVCAGDEEGVRMWEGRAEGVGGERVVVRVEEGEEEWEDEEGSGSEEDEDESENEAPRLFDGLQYAVNPEPVVDEDGFTLVQGKGKGRR